MNINELPIKMQNRIVITDNGCWEWTGVLTKDLYGRFAGRGAHRITAALAYGPIPTGMQVDHVCHNDDATCTSVAGCRHRRCVNPAHLRIVTPRENTLASRNTLGGKNIVKTHCAAGHEFAGWNLYVPPSGERRCRTCMAAADARWIARRAGIPAAA
jgi:hypothetical protein